MCVYVCVCVCVCVFTCDDDVNGYSLNNTLGPMILCVCTHISFLFIKCYYFMILSALLLCTLKTSKQASMCVCVHALMHYVSDLFP